MTPADKLSDSRRLTGWQVSGCEMRSIRRLCSVADRRSGNESRPAVTCRAGGLVIEAPSLAAAPGSSGSFDVQAHRHGSCRHRGVFSVSLDSIELAGVGTVGRRVH